MATTKVLKIKVDAETKKALKGMKTLQTQTAKSTAGFKKMGGTIMKFVGAALVLKAFKDVTKAAIKQENSIKNLNTALKNTGEEFANTQGGIDAMSKNLQQVAADIQKVTTVGDEVTLEMMQMGLGMGITADKIGEASKEAIGLSKAYKIDLRASIKMVALARAGDFNMLQRYIPQLKMAKTAAEKQAIATKAMAGGYEIAKAEAETFGGKLTQLGNTFGDFKERVGAGITQNEGFAEALDGIKELLEDPAITDGLAAMAGGVATLAANLVKAMGVFPRFINAVTELKKANDDLARGQTTQAESFDKALKKADQFRAAIDDPSDLRIFWKELEKITSSSDDFSVKAEKMNGLFREMRDGKFGEGLAEDFGKFRKEQSKSAIEAAKLKAKLEAEAEAARKAAEAILNLGGNTGDTGKEFTSLSNVSTDLIGKIQQLSWWMDQTGQSHKSADKAVKEMADKLMAESEAAHDASDGIEFFVEATDDAGEATNFWETSLGNLIITTQSVFSSLSRLGGGLGNLAGHLETVTADVGNLIGGLGGKKFGLKDIPNAINLGVSAFQLLGPAISAVGSAIGSFFDMWGDSEWKKLLRSTDDETEAIWDMINTLGMTPGVIDTIKNRLDTLPAGFEATRRGLEQLLIDAGAAEAGMRGLAGRPELEADAGSFKHQTDTPTFDKNSFNPDGGGGGFMSAANGFNGVLKRDTLIQAHKGEPVSITPKGQAGGGVDGGDKVDARRYNFDNTFQFNLTESAILKIVANGFRKNREQLNRVAKESMGIG